MPDWFRNAVTNGEHLTDWRMLLTRVALAVVCGFIVAGVYAGTLGRRRDDVRTLATTLVLLCVLIAVVTMVIGDSVARAFGLVGALSIIRFRTVVEDTRDTAFVIFAVAVGMAVGSGYSELTILAIPAVGLSALIMAMFDKPPLSATVSVTVKLALGTDPDVALTPILAKYLDDRRLKSTGTAKQGAALEVCYVGRLFEVAKAVAFVSELNKVEGVQGVELRQS